MDVAEEIIVKKKKDSKFTTYLGIVFFLILGYIAYHDLISIPAQNRDYVKSCYNISFIGLKGGRELRTVRDLFRECLGDWPTQEKAYECWMVNSPDTINESDLISKCASNLYDSQKIVFK